MRRPTINQLTLVRSVAGNGWGDGDFIESMDDSEKRKYIIAMQRFEQWIEHLQGCEFKSPIV